MRTYTFGQCARVLEVDPKVFRRWVKEDLGLQEREQVSRADRRVRYLTDEQLAALATLHDRTLPTDGEQEKQADITPAWYKLLEDRVISVEAALHACEQTMVSVQEKDNEGQERLMQVEQHIENMLPWNGLLEKLPAWMTRIETHVERLKQPDQLLVALEAQYRQQIAELEARYQQQIKDLEAQLAHYRTDEHPSPTPSTTTKKKKIPSRTTRLPKSLASRRTFAVLHHIPDSVVARACNSGKIAATNGRWLYQSRIIFQALGERGRHDFYQLFHARPDFTPCKQCPHAIP
jgi:myosin heavy subunit